MSIFIKKSGILTTVQDTGRNGFRRFGINPNGAMDAQAVRLINILLGNDDTEAVLEMHFPAPVFEFEEDAVIALGGADFGAKINGQPTENWRPFYVERGNELTFEKKIFGIRAYLAVKGGFELEKWLDSFSTNLRAEIGGFEGRTLQKNDRVFFNSKFQTPNSKFDYKISSSLSPNYQKSAAKIRVIEGAEFEMLTALSELNFLKREFTITPNSDRMGFRLRGEPLYLLDNIELVSSAVNFGTIQLLPDGQMIILMADHQTSGGYPRIANVVSADLPILAQLNPNKTVGFEIVSQEEAENLLMNFENELNYLKFGVKSKLQNGFN
ncbi:MAG: biotin-dependent carboxyltransferase family protein [Acidobacteriota bacterium]